VESRASFVWWLHSETGLSFHGDAPIAGLTPAEADTLLLGHLVTQEQQQNGNGSDPLRSRKRDLEQGQQQARQEMLADAGFE
jgi:hypothetical protein